MNFECRFLLLFLYRQAQFKKSKQILFEIRHVEIVELPRTFDEKSDCFDEFFTIVDCCCCCCNEFPTAAAAGVAAWVCGAAGDAVAFSRTFADDFVLPRLRGFQPFSRRNLSMSSYISFPESLAYFSSPFSLIFPVGLRKSPMKTLVLKLKCSRWRFLTPFFSRYYKE